MSSVLPPTPVERARAARERGLEWNLLVAGEEIDATTLAFVPTRRMATEWVDNCIRSIRRARARVNGVLYSKDAAEIKRTLMSFWTGE